MRQYCQGYVHQKLIVLEMIRERKYWNKMQRTTAKQMPSGTRWRTAAACSSSCSKNSSVATHRAAAAEIYGRYIQIHTRSSYSSLQLNSIVTIYQVQVLCCESTHGAQQNIPLVVNKKRSKIKQWKVLRDLKTWPYSRWGRHLLLNQAFHHIIYLNFLCIYKTSLRRGYVTFS